MEYRIMWMLSWIEIAPVCVFSMRLPTISAYFFINNLDKVLKSFSSRFMTLSIFGVFLSSATTSKITKLTIFLFSWQLQWTSDKRLPWMHRICHKCIESIWQTIKIGWLTSSAIAPYVLYFNICNRLLAESHRINGCNQLFIESAVVFQIIMSATIDDWWRPPPNETTTKNVAVKPYTASPNRVTCNHLNLLKFYSHF